MSDNECDSWCFTNMGYAKCGLVRCRVVRTHNFRLLQCNLPLGHTGGHEACGLIWSDDGGTDVNDLLATKIKAATKIIEIGKSGDLYVAAHKFLLEQFKGDT